MSLFHPLLFFYCDSDVCVDTVPEGAVGGYGYDCDYYIGSESCCGSYDDTDFKSEEMCCACGGGISGGNACKYTNCVYEMETIISPLVFCFLKLTFCSNFATFKVKRKKNVKYNSVATEKTPHVILCTVQETRGTSRTARLVVMGWIPAGLTRRIGVWVPRNNNNKTHMIIS